MDKLVEDYYQRKYGTTNRAVVVAFVIVEYIIVIIYLCAYSFVWLILYPFRRKEEA